MRLLKRLWGLVVAFVALILIVLPIFVTAQTPGRRWIPSSQTICGGPCPLIDTEFQFNATSIANFIISIARFITFITGALAVLFIVFAGLLIVTDGGDGKRSGQGWKIIRSSLIGLVIVILAYTLVSFVGNLIQGNLLGEIVENQTT